MGIKIGDIDVVNEVIDLRYQLIRTQLLLDYVLTQGHGILPLTQDRLNQIEAQALQMLQNKYPNMGIART